MVTEDLEKLIGDIAVKGAQYPGADGWRGERACRYIAQLLNREVPERPKIEEVLT